MTTECRHRGLLLPFLTFKWQPLREKVRHSDFGLKETVENSKSHALQVASHCSEFCPKLSKAGLNLLRANHVSMCLAHVTCTSKFQTYNKSQELLLATEEGTWKPLPCLPDLSPRALPYLCSWSRPGTVHFPLFPGPDRRQCCEVGISLSHLCQLLLLHLHGGKETRAIYLSLLQSSYYKHSNSDQELSEVS